MTAGEDVELVDEREVLEPGLLRLLATGEAVPLARRRQRLRMRRRHRRLRALAVSAMWAAVVLVAVILLLSDWVSLRFS